MVQGLDGTAPSSDPDGLHDALAIVLWALVEALEHRGSDVDAGHEISSSVVVPVQSALATLAATASRDPLYWQRVEGHARLILQSLERFYGHIDNE